MGMSAGRRGPDPRLVAGAGAVAAALFIALFRFRRLGPLDFWAWLAANVAIVIGLSFVLDRGYAARLKRDVASAPLRKIGIGIASAAVLYAVFAAGRLVALRLFPFAAAGIGSVYALKEGASILRIGLLIGFIIGPGEELFWRGFLQERFGGATRPGAGFVLATLLYAAVHLASGNIMLVLAAAVCGFFWGWLYLSFRSPLMNVVSHTLWDLAVFVIFPF